MQMLVSSAPPCVTILANYTSVIRLGGHDQTDWKDVGMGSGVIDTLVSFLLDELHVRAVHSGVREDTVFKWVSVHNNQHVESRWFVKGYRCNAKDIFT